jgi:hypothetical protein
MFTWTLPVCGPNKEWASRGSCQDVTEIIGNMVLVNSGFHMRETFSENYPHLGHEPPTIFASPVLRRKTLKKYISFKGRLLACSGHQVFNLPGAPTCLGPALYIWINYWVLIKKAVSSTSSSDWKGREFKTQRPAILTDVIRNFPPSHSANQAGSFLRHPLQFIIHYYYSLLLKIT